MATLGSDLTDDSEKTVLSLSVLGSLRAHVGGKEVRLRTRKAKAILGYLALTEACRETRERLVGLFWSEFGEQQARASLRQVLHELGEALEGHGFDGLIRERMEVKLNPARVTVDYWDLATIVDRRRTDPRLLNTHHIDETLLRGLDDLDQAFRVWLLAKRQSLHDRLLRGLEAGLADPDVDAWEQRRLAEAILGLDATHEDACRALMRLHAEEGDVAASLRVYSALWDLLDEDFGMEPSAPTQQLVAEIKQGKFDTSPDPRRAIASADDDAARRASDELIMRPVAALALPPGVPSPAPVARLALLVEPFGATGSALDSLYLIEGFRHDLIAYLVRFREWIVVATGSLPDDPDVTSRISSAYCVAGSVYQVGGTFSIVLTLRELESGIHVWSDRFELALENWFEAQKRIVRQITISLNIHVSLGRLARVAAEPDVSLPAYDLWLRGQAALNQFDAENWPLAARMFTEAIERAPDFAPGYSSLAQMNNVVHFVHPGRRRGRVREQHTLQLARKAVSLDPMDSRSHLCLGWSLAMLANFPQAATHMELACELNPNDSWTLISAGLCLAYGGELERAWDLASQSLSLTLAPSRLHWAYHIQISFLHRDYQTALEAAERSQHVMLAMDGWRAAILWHLGDTAQAARAARRFINLIRSHWFGETPPTDEAIGRWLLHMFPFRHESDWALLRDGVAGAGIPVSDARHGDW